MVAPRTNPVVYRRGAGRLIYIAGCDGTGKSTQAALLLAALAQEGVRARHVWLRFPFLLSLPLLAYARSRGLSWHEEANGVRHGYWNFSSSPLLLALLPWTLLLDAALAAIGKIYLPLALGSTVVCERFALDMLADLAVAFDDAAFQRGLPGRLFRRLIPPGATIAVLDLDVETARSRRSDLLQDRRLEARLAAFRQIASDFRIATLSSKQSVEDVQQQIRELGAAPPNSSHISQSTIVMVSAANHLAGKALQCPARCFTEPALEQREGFSTTMLPLQKTPKGFASGALPPPKYGYAKVRSGALRRLMGYAPVAVLSHWAFQSLFYMDATERRFKIGVELALGAVCALALGAWLPAGGALVGGFLAAHTLNFLFNGHLWGVLKHYGLVYTSADDFDAYVRALQARARREPSLGRLVVFGSVSRAEWSPTSDLDVRVVRRGGLLNGLRACWFVLRERARAMVRRFPLDIYVFDGARALAGMSQNEQTLDIL